LYKLLKISLHYNTSYIHLPFTELRRHMKLKNVLLSATLLLSSIILLPGCSQNDKTGKTDSKKTAAKTDSALAEAADTLSVKKSEYPPIDKKLYDSLMKFNAHGDTTGRWPVKNTPYPVGGAILPFKRVVAFYGNLYSKKMGILGELAS
jgi:hypothetical protein